MRRLTSCLAVPLALAVLVCCAGCATSKKGRVLSGTSTTIGMMVPLTSTTSASFNLLEYVTGLYLGMNEDSVVWLDHELEIDNSYFFGAVTHKEKRHLSANVENYAQTNMLEKVKSALHEASDERKRKILEAQARLLEAKRSLAKALVEAQTNGVPRSVVSEAIATKEE